ncbi:hypothetical protein [Sphingobacterium siyangense]
MAITLPPLTITAYPPPIGYRSIGPSVGLLHRQLFRNRRYPATVTDRIKSYYFLPVSYSCISIGLAVATCNTVYAIRLLGSIQVMVHSHSRRSCSLYCAQW